MPPIPYRRSLFSLGRLSSNSTVFLLVSPLPRPLIHTTTSACDCWAPPLWLSSHLDSPCARNLLRGHQSPPFSDAPPSTSRYDQHRALQQAPHFDPLHHHANYRPACHPEVVLAWDKIQIMTIFRAPKRPLESSPKATRTYYWRRCGVIGKMSATFKKDILRSCGIVSTALMVNFGTKPGKCSQQARRYPTISAHRE